MDQKKARETAEKLGLAIGANPEQSFLTFGCIFGLDWLGDDVWIPRGEPAAHWVTGTALARVVADLEEPRVELHSIAAPSSWTAGAVFRRTGSGDPIDRRLWLASEWKFRLADGYELEVRGKFGVDREKTEPDEAEVFARILARTMADA